MPPPPWLELYGNLAFYGLVGCLIRVGLNKLTGFEYGGILWANVCGCVVMGLHKHVLPTKMHVHIGTGLAGSITSFSSLIAQLFLQSTHRVPSWNNSGYGVMVFLQFLIIEFACSISSLTFGTHLSLLFGGKKLNLSESSWLYFALPALALAGMIISLVCAITLPESRYWTLMLLFAPFGVWLRYYMSRFNGKLFKTGTFAVNIIGTILVAIFYLLGNQHFDFNHLQKTVLLSLIDGFCGNLTTISTFVNELVSMPTKAAYLYFIASVGVGFLCTFLIMGPYMWVHDSPYLF